MGPNAERLREMYDAFWNRGDVNAGRDVLADDIVWSGPDEVGLSGVGHGRTAVAEFFRNWLEAWESYSNDIDVEELTPDLLLVRSRFRGVGKGSGIEFEMEIGQVWEFEDGKAVRQTMYRTYEEARQAADLLASQQSA